MNLRGKLNSLFGLTLLLGFALVAAESLALVKQQLLAEIEQSTYQVLASVVRTLQDRAPAASGSDRLIIRQVLQDACAGRPYIVSASATFVGPPTTPAITVPDYHVPAGSSPASGRDHEELIVATETIRLGDEDVRITLEADVTIAAQLRSRLLRSYLLVAGLTLIGALFVTSIGVHRLVIAPIAQFRRLTRKVAAGDLEALPPWPLRQRQDEIGVLATSFANMVDALKQAREANEALVARIQTYAAQLDTRVTEATAQLGRTNEELEIAHAALLDAQGQLARQERLVALGQLVGSIAHEIGTPLSTISGHLQLLLYEDLPGEVHDSIQIAHGEALRMTEIIRRFLSSTRGIQPTRAAFDLPELLQQIVELSFPSGGRWVVGLDVSDEARQPHSDAGLIQQILVNLVVNARDAMPGGGRVAITARRQGNWLVVDVDDDGPGVSPALRERIFEPFFTTKGPDLGTGLGLAICKEIVRALRGSLDPGNSPLGGARFTVKLPAWDQDGGGA